MEIKQHVPNFVDGIEPRHAFFKTIEELLAIPWVNAWADDGYKGLPFWRFSQSKYGDQYLLMAEWKNENDHRWWVIGYMTEPTDLPNFDDSFAEGQE